MSARHLGLHSLALAAALAAAGLRPAVAHAAGVYFVKEGDSLEKVARVFAADASRIRALNGLRREIRPGHRLRIPDPAPPPARGPASSTS